MILIQLISWIIQLFISDCFSVQFWGQMLQLHWISLFCIVKIRQIKVKSVLKVKIVKNKYSLKCNAWRKVSVLLLQLLEWHVYLMN